MFWVKIQSGHILRKGLGEEKTLPVKSIRARLGGVDVSRIVQSITMTADQGTT